VPKVGKGAILRFSTVSACLRRDFENRAIAVGSQAMLFRRSFHCWLPSSRSEYHRRVVEAVQRGQRAVGVILKTVP